MTVRTRQDDEWELLQKAIARLRASVMAVVFGLVGGTGLFVATVWLVVRGGADVGLHLGLLSNYIPGYTVTWTGSLIGFAYGVVIGAVIGGSIAWLYNRIVDRRHPS